HGSWFHQILRVYRVRRRAPGVLSYAEYMGTSDQAHSSGATQGPAESAHGKYLPGLPWYRTRRWAFRLFRRKAGSRRQFLDREEPAPPDRSGPVSDFDPSESAAERAHQIQDHRLHDRRQN